MKKLFFLALIVTMLATYVSADEIILDRSQKGSGIEIIAQHSSRGNAAIILNCNIQKLTSEVVDTPKGKFTLLSIPKFQATNEIGNPRIPMMNQLLEIPVGGSYSIRVLDQETKEYQLEELGVKYPIIPRQPSREKNSKKVEFVYNEDAYKQKGFTRNDLVKIEKIGLLRTLNLALVKFSPISYDPSGKKIQIANNIQVEIVIDGCDFERTNDIKNKYYSPYFNWASKNVLTPDFLTVKERNVSRAPVYLIIADRMFEKDLVPFITWKTEKGFQVTVAYTDVIGNDAESIKNFIHAKYKNATESEPAPSFVLFVGDHEQIPAFKGESSSRHITDLYHVAVTDDYLPDMLYGRFSARDSGELIPQIEKTLEYEKYEFADPSFLERAVMIAGWDYSHAVEWGWPQIKYGLKYYFKKEFGFNDVEVYLSAGSHQNESKIHNGVSKGVCYVNYTAHGSSTTWADPGFTQSDINALMNKGKYPLVVGNCCLTNKFEVSTCFGEAWLRAKDKGAIGYIGGSNSTYWDEDLWWGNGFYSIVHPNKEGTPPTKEETGNGAYDCMFTEDNFSNSAMFVNGNLAVEASNTSRKLYYWEVYHLMGDPSLMIYLGIPKKMEVSHPQTVDVNSKDISIQAEKHARVTISMNGEIIGTKYTDADGKNALSVKFSNIGTAKIVVTKKNRIPYIAEINVK